MEEWWAEVGELQSSGRMFGSFGGCELPVGSAHVSLRMWKVTWPFDWLLRVHARARERKVTPKKPHTQIKERRFRTQQK